MDENFSFRIFYGREGSFQSNNLTKDTLCDRIDLPLCAPDCALQHATYSKRRSTVRCLIDRNHGLRKDWFAFSGVGGPAPEAQVSKFNDTPMCLSAAMKGVGYDDR